MAMVFLITTYAGRCSRAKPANEHQENRHAILKADTQKSNIDSLERAQWAIQKKALLDSIKHLNQKYKAIAQKDDKVESRYRQAPNIVTCDSVIDSKNLRIGTLESMASHKDQVNRVNDSLLASYAGSIQAKNQTISQLNSGYEQATKDLEQALRPKRWGLGIMAGAGIGPSLKPGPMVGVGLSYNFIRF